MLFVGIVMLIAAGVLIYFYMNGKKPEPDSLAARNQLAAEKAAALRAANEPQGLDIQNAKPGAVVHLEGVGLEMASWDLQITGRHLVKEGGDRWWELAGTSGTDSLYITLEDGEIYVTTAEPRLADLGIKPGDLDGMRVADDVTVHYQGVTYTLAAIGVASYCENGNELAAETFHYWDFEAEDGSQFLGISRWPDGSCEASYSVPIRANQVTVYSIS